MDIRKFFKVETVNPKGTFIKPKVDTIKPKVDIENGYETDVKPSTIRVYTDGSAINNGKKNCYGGIGIFFGDNDPRNVGDKLSTDKISNNVAELIACQRAIEILINDDKVNNKIIICTDSEYMINCITVWVYSWEKNNWQRNVKGKNKPIKNLDIIKKIKSYVDKYNIIFKHIKSHKTSPSNKNSLEYFDWYGNDMADKLAKKGAEK